MLDAATQETLLKKNLANVLSKLQRGGTLTARELALVSGANGERGYCSNLDELATQIGIDRRTITNAKRRFAKSYGERKKVLERADGRYHIASWRDFLNAHGVVGRAKSGEPELEDERALRLRATRLDLERKEYELARSKEKMLPCSEYETALSMMLGAFSAALNALPGRAGGKILPKIRSAILRSLRSKLTPTVFAKVDAALSGADAIDFADVEEVLLSEVDLVKRTLSECEYLKADQDLD